MDLVLDQLIDIPTLAASLLQMLSTDDRTSYKRARIAQCHLGSPCQCYASCQDQCQVRV